MLGPPIRIQNKYRKLVDGTYELWQERLYDTGYMLRNQVLMSDDLGNSVAISEDTFLSVLLRNSPDDLFSGEPWVDADADAEQGRPTAPHVEPEIDPVLLDILEALDMSEANDDQNPLTTLQSFEPAELPTEKPLCPRHNTFMRYVPDEDKMVCTNDECTFYAVRAPSFKERMKVSDIYRGTTQLVRDEHGNVYVRLLDWNALVDVTPIMTWGREEKKKRKEANPADKE